MSAPEIAQTLVHVAQAKKISKTGSFRSTARYRSRRHDRNPSAALAINTFINKLDFLSISKFNDLIQYIASN